MKIKKFTVGIQVGEFDKKLLERSKMFDAIGSRLGDLAPRKRLLMVDYKEKGRDMHQSLMLCQPPEMDDTQMVNSIKRYFEDQGRTVSSIVDVDDNGCMIAPLYTCPGFLEECRQDAEKLFREHN